MNRGGAGRRYVFHRSVFQRKPAQMSRQGGMPVDALEDIFSRHSIAKLRPDPVPRELVEKLLAAAVQAPNHYRVRPWRFIILTGQARTRLGEVMVQSLLKRHPDALAVDLNKERTRFLRAPVVV